MSQIMRYLADLGAGMAGKEKKAPAIAEEATKDVERNDEKPEPVASTTKEEEAGKPKKGQPGPSGGGGGKKKKKGKR
jgi:hypothetical protein